MKEFDFGATGENHISEVEEVPPRNAVPVEFTVRFDQTGDGFEDMGKIWAADKSLTRSILNRAVKMLKTRRNPMLFSRRTLDYHIDTEEMIVSLKFTERMDGPTGFNLSDLKKDDWDPGIIVPPGSSEEEVEEAFSPVKYPNDPNEFDPEIT
jgi:hypothetical protein